MAALSFSYDSAVALLDAASGIISQNPACNLPVLDRFRAFVAQRTVARLDLTPDEGAELDRLESCAEGRPMPEKSTPAAFVGAVLAAGLLGYLIWKA